MYRKCDGIETMMNNEADEVIKDLSESLKKIYQNNLEKSMGGSEFSFDYLHLLYYIYHKIIPVCGGLYLNSPDWIKKAIINPINKEIINAFNMV